MKNLLPYFGALLISLMSISCKDSKGDDIEKSLGGYVATGVNIRIKDSNGNDRLAPTAQNALRKFKVYYLVNDHKQLYSNPWMTASGGYNIKKYDPGNYYYLQVFLNCPTPEDTNPKEWITYLEFEDGSIDTIKATFDVKPGYIAIDKAWYNNKLEWYRTEVDSLEVLELTKP